MVEFMIGVVLVHSWYARKGEIIFDCKGYQHIY